MEQIEVSWVMKIGFTILLFLLLLFVSNFSRISNGVSLPSTTNSEEAVTDISQSKSSDIAQRIKRVENGLLLPVIIKGQPSEPMKLADRMRFFNTPGASVAVINNGRIEWARGYGIREVGKNEPVTTATIFQAGSISKPIAATMALQMVQRGRLALDEDVNKKLVSWKVPENEFTKEQKVTLRRILSHSAGFTNNSAGNYISGAELPTLLQILDGLKPANTLPIRVDFVPGSRWRYSGGGYGVAQQLIIDASGKQFPNIAQEIIFDRLKMKHTTFEQPLREKFHKAAAVGHNREGEKIAGNWLTFPEMAAAGMWSTPSDLARFALELQKSKAGKSNKILSTEMTKQMLTRQIADWGIGLVVEGEGRSARFSHGGDTEGYKCLMIAYQNTGQGAVIMTNSDRGNRFADEILRSIAKEYGWGDYQPKEKVIAAVNPQIFEAYFGQYELEISPDFVVTISAKNGNLMMTLKQPTGESNAELLPESETRFFRRDVDFEMTFVKSDTGQATGLIIRQDGAEYRAKKIK
jgi:CubicO group peptidase (beta-lactamase class C family)